MDLSVYRPCDFNSLHGGGEKWVLEQEGHPSLSLSCSLERHHPPLFEMSVFGEEPGHSVIPIIPRQMGATCQTVGDLGFIPFSYYQSWKQVSVALLDGGWLTIPAVEDWTKVPTPPILNLTTMRRWTTPPKLSSYFCEWKNNHTHLSPHCHRLDGLDNRHFRSYGYHSGGLRAQITAV